MPVGLTVRLPSQFSCMTPRQGFSVENGQEGQRFFCGGRGSFFGERVGKGIEISNANAGNGMVSGICCEWYFFCVLLICKQPV